MHPGAKSVTQRLFINQITAEEANYPKPASEALVGATSSQDHLTAEGQSDANKTSSEDPFEQQ
jgi:hypothetical protein